MSIVFFRTAVRALFCRRRTRGGAAAARGGRGALGPGDEDLGLGMVVLLPSTGAIVVPAA